MARCLLNLKGMRRIPRARLSQKLEALYHQYNQRSFVDPDPLLFLYDYPRVKDREIAGLIAACLAYGRVAMIMKTVGTVLDTLGPDLHDALTHTGQKDLERIFHGFRYRFASQAHLTALLLGIQDILNTYGSIEACFLAGAEERPPLKGKRQARLDIHGGLAAIYEAVSRRGCAGHLLADPGKTSACKRSHLFLRWMVRNDRVDPGGWASVSPASLVVPVDTHMYKIGILLGFTRRKAADKACALEITEGFRRLAPEDPVRYDFALTRFGIRREFDANDLKDYLNGKDTGKETRKENG